MILEKESSQIPGIHHIISEARFGTKNICEHLQWMKNVKKIYKQVQPDVIHFVWGDSFYCMMGIGFLWLKGKNAIITFHQVRKSWLHKLSIKIYSKLFKTLVVHTDSLLVELKNLGIRNIRKIEYPNFRKIDVIDKKIAKKKLGIETDAPVLLSIGGTRKDKGLDLLLLALQEVNAPFFLLVAGAEQNIKRGEIKEKSKSYERQTKVIMKYLSNDELNLCYSAADIIVLPYRFEFDGASGPLAEGVGYGKVIVGSNHGSLGRLIRDHHIGRCFKTEDVGDMKKVIEEVLLTPIQYDNMAQKYQEELNVEYFMRQYEKIYNI